MMRNSRYHPVFRPIACAFLLLSVAVGATVGDGSLLDKKSSAAAGTVARSNGAAAGNRGPRPPAQPVRGIYVSSDAARSGRMESLIRLVRTTELNAMVIDVNGAMTIRPGAPQAQTTAGFRRLVNRLKGENVYLIARVVTFKDPKMVQAAPALALRRKDGSIWRDPKGEAWLEPFRREAWAYPIALAEEAARIGFDEVQFDYVRFPENRDRVDREVAFRNPEHWSRNEAVGRFLQEATRRVHRAGAVVSADVFGVVASSRADVGIGQSWRTIASTVDVISPMVYPSHYAAGMWGIRHPDLMPGAVVARALQDAGRNNRRLRAQGLPAAQVRPWLQSFTAVWVHPHQRYGTAQIREQIRAAQKEGLNSYLLWNASCRYPNP